MSKSIIYGLVASVLAFSAVLAVSETALRFSGRFPVHGLHTAPDGVFEMIPGAFDPGQDFVYRKNPSLPHRIRINSLGFRGPEVPLEKPPGTLRVLCLGDSLTFGDFVEDDETIPARLQSLFRDKKSEFVNAGVGGSTIVDQLYYLKKSIVMAPDVVVLTFFLNDIPELASPETQYEQFEKNRRFKSSFLQSGVYANIRDTALFQIFLKFRAKYLIRVERDGAPVEEHIEREDRLLKRYAGLFKEMKSYLDARSIRFIFVIFPSHAQIGAKTDVTGLHNRRIAWMEEMGAGLGVPTVNLLGAFSASGLGKTELYLLPHDGHPSKKAYSIAAAEISGVLKTVVSGAEAVR